MSPGSFFDVQNGNDLTSQNSGNSSNAAADSASFMGPRGENTGLSEVDNYNNKLAEFNMGAGQAAPKRSKLIFTNVIIPVDMTTQYVLIILVFVIAAAAAVGYYFYKKKDRAEKSGEENYD